MVAAATTGTATNVIFPAHAIATMFANTYRGDGCMERTTSGLVFSYLWTIGTSLIFPLAFWYVLERVTDRTDVMIICIAGILYAAVAQGFHYQQLVFHRLSKQIGERTVALQRIVDPSWVLSADENQKVLAIVESSDLHANIKIALMSWISVGVFIYFFFRLLSALG